MSDEPAARILVVDDQASIHRDFLKILTPRPTLTPGLSAAAGTLFERHATPTVPAHLFELDCASNGEQALDRVEQAVAQGRPYALAFVDMRMPRGWDGLETITQCWRVQPDLQIVICTAHSDHSWAEINDRLRHSDRFLVLKKPFDPVEVFQTAVALTSRARVERELAMANRRLVDHARLAGMSEVATGILHNVGNVLTSAHVSLTMAVQGLRALELSGLARAVELLRAHQQDLAGFLTADPRGRLLPGYLGTLSERLQHQQAEILAELRSLRERIDHITELVTTQEQHVQRVRTIQDLPATELIESALCLVADVLDQHGIVVDRQYHDAPVVRVERHKALQILVNLVRNATEAMSAIPPAGRKLTIGLAGGPGHQARIVVSDTGVGISPEHLTRIFQYGYTTKPQGHGLGLHSAALAAREIGGALGAQSEGSGKGACFTLELPVAPKDQPEEATTHALVEGS